MAPFPTVAHLRALLSRMIEPGSGKTLSDADAIESVEVRDGRVRAALRTTRAQASAMEGVRRAAETALGREPGVVEATVVLTAHRDEAPPKPVPPSQRPKLLSDIGAVIAVASGKGGVGKSTIAVNLAVALARRGLRVGLLDADIYGPSLPVMLGLDRKPDVRDGRIQPLRAWGLTAMSIGFLVDTGTAMVWRGPMVMGALEQMMGQVDWGPLDLMVVDMPPGTGDAQLTMAQRVSLAGAVIVSTPQDMALADARRGVRMFEQTGVPVLGMIENMSFFQCPHCGQASHPFGHGGARAEAERLGVPFLGEIPLQLDIRSAGDSGTPIMVSDPDGVAGRAFATIAARIAPRPAA